MTTYYTAKTAEGLDTAAQARKLGTPAYGYTTLAQAMRYCPVDGYVEERHSENGSDWAGIIYPKEA